MAGGGRARKPSTQDTKGRASRGGGDCSRRALLQECDRGRGEGKVEGKGTGPCSLTGGACSDTL